MAQNDSGISIVRLAAIVFGVLFAAGLLTAAMMAGGLFSMPKTVVVSGGGTSSKSGGAFSLAHVIAQPNAKVLSGGALTLTSGYFSGARLSIAVAPAIISTGIPYQQISDGVLFGVPWNANFSVTFNRSMDPSTLGPAATLTALVDHLGNAIQNSAALSASYDGPSNTLTLTPTVALSENTEYLLTFSTVAAAPGGTAIKSGFSQTFWTIVDQNQQNRIVSADSSGGVQLILPPLTLPTSGYIIIKDDPIHHPDRVDPNCIIHANQKIIDELGTYDVPVAVREINAYNAAGQVIEPSTPGLDLIMSYFQNAQGFVQSITPPIRPSTLRLWVLDCVTVSWSPLAGSSVDTPAQDVSAPLPHLSVYGLIGGAATDVSGVYAYPVPWKPFSPDPQRYGSLNGGITFTNLPSQGSIRIFSISGELVRNLDHENGLTTEGWDGTNGNGSRVASGVYLWDIRSGGNRKSGKLMVVW